MVNSNQASERFLRARHLRGDAQRNLGRRSLWEYQPQMVLLVHFYKTSVVSQKTHVSSLSVAAASAGLRPRFRFLPFLCFSLCGLGDMAARFPDEPRHSGG